MRDSDSIAYAGEAIAFFQGYAECALWSSTDDNGNPLDGVDAQLSTEAIDKMMSDCKQFQERERALLDEAIDDHHMAASHLGHDFWLTRNHHGAGFWDRGLEELGNKLTTAAHAFGECTLFVSDSNTIEIL